MKPAKRPDLSGKEYAYLGRFREKRNAREGHNTVEEDIALERARTERIIAELAAQAEERRKQAAQQPQNPALKGLFKKGATSPNMAGWDSAGGAL